MNLSHTTNVMSFKRTLSIVGLSSSLVGFANADIESSISAGYESQYIYRGVDLGADRMTLDLNATAKAAALGLDWSVGLHHGTADNAGLNLTSVGAGPNGEDVVTPLIAPGGTAETRIHVGASTALTDGININGGAISYTYSSQINDRLELYLGASTTVACIDFAATAFFNQSNDWFGDTYYELSASYTASVSENTSATLGVTYGNWDEDPILGALEDVDYLTISGTLNFDLGDNVSATVGVSHVSPDLSDDETIVGTSLTLGF